jgi:DUF917 family protein
VNSEHELRARALLLETFAAAGLPGALTVTMSHEVGGVGLLERENAACLNECLRPLALKTVAGLTDSLTTIGLRCPLYLTQNDGTVASIGQAVALPIRCISSGPVNSVRGAAQLTGLTDCIVVDVGGTTSDFGVMVGGFPRVAASETYVAGVRTNFAMPDVYSIALGGGSRLQLDDAGLVEGIDEQSVGYRLRELAVCFGGGVLTASDAAVRLGRAAMGETAPVAAALPEDAAEHAWALIQAKLEAGVDAVKTSAATVPVVVVGGGAVLVGAALAGASEVLIPADAGCANAVGAARAQVSGVVDIVVKLGGGADARVQIMRAVESEAVAQAEAAGAARGSVEILSREEVPLAYLPGGSCRVKVVAVGDLDLSRAVRPPEPGMAAAAAEEEEEVPAPAGAHEAEVAGVGYHVGDTVVDEWWEPAVLGRRWTLVPQDVEALAIGCGILGTGGGGSPHKNKLAVLQTMAGLPPGAAVTVVPLETLPAAGLVSYGAEMGAPTVGLEKLHSGEALTATMAAVDAVRALSPAEPPALAGMCSAEIGGSNGLMPFKLSGPLGLPVVDGDLMARAFPQLNMHTSAIYGEEVAPAGLTDSKGNKVVVEHVADQAAIEALMRPVCEAMGCTAGFCLRPLPAATMARCIVPGTVSRAWRLGRAVLGARRAKADPIAAVLDSYGNGQLIFVGKVVDVQRATTGGFARGTLELAGLAEGGGGGLRIDFQNENLVATDAATGAVLATVPDLICCMETESGRPIATEEMRYGLRLSVLALPAPPQLTSAQALGVVGPEAFGYEGVPYTPIGDYVHPVPVVP